MSVVHNNPYETVVCKGEGGSLTALFGLVMKRLTWGGIALACDRCLLAAIVCLCSGHWLLLCSPEYFIFKFEVWRFSCSVNVLASQHHTHAGGKARKKHKIYHILPSWLNTAVKCTRRRVVDYHPKNTILSQITVGAEYRSKLYHRVVDYHPKIPCITVGAEYHGNMDQSGRLPSKKCRSLPWG